jgi:hypothetical protein
MSLYFSSRDINSQKNCSSNKRYFRILTDNFISKEDNVFFTDAFPKIGKGDFGFPSDNALEDSPDDLFCSFMVDSDYAEYENVDDSQNSSLYE